MAPTSTSDLQISCLSINIDTNKRISQPIFEYMSANNKESVSIDISKSFQRKSDKKMKFISWYYKFTESVVLNYFKMPSTPYDLVRDEQDLRIPLHAEQAFFHGITFQAKVSAYPKQSFPSSFVSHLMNEKTGFPPNFTCDIDLADCHRSTAKWNWRSSI